MRKRGYTEQDLRLKNRLYEEGRMIRVKQIKIDFHVTESIKRFAYVYLVETGVGCVLVDSGVAGSEKIIEKPR